MTMQNAALTDFFTIRRARDEAMALATIIETIGSTYSKAGAQMLIGGDGQAAGLLSGGCAEADLIERAQRVIATGRAEIAEYDTRGSDDVIWGIGLGCEGAMRILLSRIDAHNDYQPFTFIVQSKAARVRGAFAFAIGNAESTVIGQHWRSDERQIPPPIRKALDEIAAGHTARITEYATNKIFVAPIPLSPRLLILGAGADAVPVVELAGLLGWQITIVDHRPAYAVAERFARTQAVILAPAAELATRINLNGFDAAVVMSHHLTTDAAYLAALADSDIAYVGLLGPANRRARLLMEIGERAARLTSRLAGPVGLDIGAQTPEAIALAIIAEIHAHRERRAGGSFSGLLQTAKLSPDKEQ